jgi:hypothetical protein
MHKIDMIFCISFLYSWIDVLDLNQPFSWSADIWEPFKMKLIWGLQSWTLVPSSNNTMFQTFQDFVMALNQADWYLLLPYYHQIKDGISQLIWFCTFWKKIEHEYFSQKAWPYSSFLNNFWAKMSDTAGMPLVLVS